MPISETELNNLCADISDVINKFVHRQIVLSWNANLTPNQIKEQTKKHMIQWFGLKLDTQHESGKETK